MMQVLGRYRALRPADRRLVVEAAIALALVRVGAALLRFPRLRDALERSARLLAVHPKSRAASGIPRVGWSVTAAARYLPFRTTCLLESLAVDAMLRRRGVRSTLRIGVRPPGGSALAAHAWVEHDGVVVYGDIPDLADYAALSAQDAR